MEREKKNRPSENLKTRPPCSQSIHCSSSQCHLCFLVALQANSVRQYFTRQDMEEIYSLFLVTKGGWCRERKLVLCPQPPATILYLKPSPNLHYGLDDGGTLGLRGCVCVCVVVGLTGGTWRTFSSTLRYKKKKKKLILLITWKIPDV